MPESPFGVIDSVSVVREAIAWLSDRRAFDERGQRLRAWNQLLDDLTLCLGELGRELRDEIPPLVGAMAPTLELKEDAGPAERMHAAAELEKLLDELDTGQAVVAAWHDLLAAYRDETNTPELCDLRESQLAALASYAVSTGSSCPVSSGERSRGGETRIRAAVEVARRVGAKPPG